MKSTLFKEIMDQNFMVIDLSPAETIRRLRAQNGYCYEEDSMDYHYSFSCSKKGKFTINVNNSTRSRSAAIYRSYYILGEVLNEQGKSRINICSINDRSNKLFLLFDALLGLIQVILYIILLLKVPSLGIWRFWLFLMMLVVSGDGLFRLISEQNHKVPDIETMKRIALRKIEAARRWEE